MKKVVVFVVLAMVVVGSLAVQSANNDVQRIIGTWTAEDTVLVFNANGTGTFNGSTNFDYGIFVTG